MSNELSNLLNESLKGISVVDKDGKYMLTALGVMSLSADGEKSFKVDRVLTPFSQDDFISKKMYELFIQIFETKIILAQENYGVHVEFPNVAPIVSCPEAKGKTVNLSDDSSYLCKLDKREEDFLRAEDVKEMMKMVSDN